MVRLLVLSSMGGPSKMDPECRTTLDEVIMSHLVDSRNFYEGEDTKWFDDEGERELINLIKISEELNLPDTMLEATSVLGLRRRREKQWT